MVDSSAAVGSSPSPIIGSGIIGDSIVGSSNSGIDCSGVGADIDIETAMDRATTRAGGESRVDDNHFNAGGMNGNDSKSTRVTNSSSPTAGESLARDNDDVGTESGENSHVAVDEKDREEGSFTKKTRLGYSSDSSNSSSGSSAGGAGIHMKLSLGRKRKRKHKEGPSITFDKEDDENERKIRLLPLELSLENDGISQAVMADEEHAGSGQAEGEINVGSRDDNKESDEISYPNKSNDSQQSSIHTHAVPPERVMSPMPQREGLIMCPSPSPNMPEDVVANDNSPQPIILDAIPKNLSQQELQQQQHIRNIYSQQQQQQQQPQQQMQHLHHPQSAQLEDQQQHQMLPSPSTNVDDVSHDPTLMATQILSPESRNMDGDGNNSTNEDSAITKSSSMGLIEASSIATVATKPSDDIHSNNNNISNADVLTTAINSSSNTPVTNNPPSQPPGWRVKLYRLNMDGTWDDCGTGRIQFYYARMVGGDQQHHHHHHHGHQLQQQQQQQQQQQRIGSTVGHSQKGSTGGGAVASPGGNQEQASPSSTSANSTKGGQQQHQHHQTPHPPPPPHFVVSPTVFRELGEPMLCMRAEIAPQRSTGGGSSGGNSSGSDDGDSDNDSISNNVSSSSSSNNKAEPKVLLRTRVLLHEAYQCQGGNIITWCEPFHPNSVSQQQQSKDFGDSHHGGGHMAGSTHLQQHQQGHNSVAPSPSPVPMGVDLALSFQDNAGCKDIWQHILDVQVRAAELARAWNGSSGSAAGGPSRGERPDATISENANASTLGSSSADGSSNGGGASPSHDTDQRHICSQTIHDDRGAELSQLRSPNGHLHPHAQQKGHDHDAVEDRQFSLVTGGVPLGHTRPQLWTSDSMAGASSAATGHRLQSHNHSTNTLQPHSSHLTHLHPHHGRAGSGIQHQDDRTAAATGFEEEDEEEEAQFNEAVEEMTAVSMAAAAAASYGVGASAGGGACGAESSSPEGCQASGDEDGTLHSPSPLPSISSGGGVQQHGFNNDMGFNMGISPSQLPNPPKLNDLERTADIMAGAQLQQREDFSIFLSQFDCSYIKALLQLFPGAEENNDYGSLATLAVCIKSILLLNDPEIIEYVTKDELMFERVCAVLEYDPELREKANHRWFIRERAKFRTVVKMEDEKLVSCIHRLFRVTYLRDTILRPTMDESSLSTLASLAQFTQSDIVLGVLPASAKADRIHDGHIIRSQMPMISKSWNVGSSDNENYFFKVLRTLGTEIRAILKMKWDEDCSSNSSVAAMVTTPPHKLPGEDDRTNTDTSAPNSPRYHSPLSSGAEEERRHGRVALPPSVKSEDGDASQQITSAASPSSQSSVMWQQHIAPQDPSLRSRYMRRQGCLSFLKELFNMARLSLQQNEKDDFIANAVSMSLPILDGPNTENSLVLGCSDDERPLPLEKGYRNLDSADENSTTKGDGDASIIIPNKQQVTSSTSVHSPPTPSYVNLLSLLGAILSDPNAVVKERGASLEILSVIALHDPAIIRRHCLETTGAGTKELADDMSAFLRPDPNELRQVIFMCPPDDLLLSLLFVMATETDAGLLLQASEIIRIILDTEMLGDQGLGGGSGFLDGESDFKPLGDCTSNQNNPHHFHDSTSGIDGSEQNSFLAMFYDRYIQWLVVPFQYQILAPRIAVPLLTGSHKNASLKVMIRMRQDFKLRSNSGDDSLRLISPCATRASFTLEILSFCVRAHVYRMKFFVLRTRLLSSILKILCKTGSLSVTPGDKCLKLACLKLLRSVLSIKDEFYHRHIVQYNLFAPVFEIFRTNPRGDNLVSSAVLEICDYIRAENIKSLLEYIVSKHFSDSDQTVNGKKLTNENPSLEDIANPYGDTLKQLRKKHEENIVLAGGSRGDSEGGILGDTSIHETLLSNGKGRPINKKALEDQRKFREADDEDSYFNTDDLDAEVAPEPSPQLSLENATEPGENDNSSSSVIF